MQQNSTDTPAIDRVRLVRRPNGEVVAINCFDFNIAYAAWKGGSRPSYVQCADDGWNRIDLLVPID